jgi:hypothetical protein
MGTDMKNWTQVYCFSVEEGKEKLQNSMVYVCVCVCVCVYVCFKNTHLLIHSKYLIKYTLKC